MISIGIFAGFALFLVVAWMIVSPLLGESEASVTEDSSSEQGVSEDQAAELELDFRTGKMSSEDYERLTQSLTEAK